MIENKIKTVLSDDLADTTKNNIVLRKIDTFMSRAKHLAPEVYIAFAVIRKKPEPVYLIKMQGVSGSAAVASQLNNEYNALKYLRSLPELQRFIPRPVFNISETGRRITGQTYLNGKTINDLLASVKSRNEICRHLDAAADFLWLMQKADRPGRKAGKGALGKIMDMESALLFKMVPGAKEAFGDRFGSSPYRDIVTDLWLNHGDFFVSNILMDQDLGIKGVIDYEDFEVDGIPLADIFHFLVTYTRAAKRSGLKGMINEGNWYRDKISEVYTRFLKKSNIKEGDDDKYFKAYILRSITRWLKPSRDNLPLATYQASRAIGRTEKFMDLLVNEIVN